MRAEWRRVRLEGAWMLVWFAFDCRCCCNASCTSKGLLIRRLLFVWNNDVRLPACCLPVRLLVCCRGKPGAPPTRAVVTEDSDLVACGCRRILFKMDT